MVLLEIDSSHTTKINYNNNEVFDISFEHNITQTLNILIN